MAAPWRHPKTGMLYLRQRTPSDLLPSMKGRKIDLPIGSETVAVTISDVIQVSLGTKDLREAKTRHALADARLRTFWARSRELTRVRAHRVDPKAAAQVAAMLAPKPYVSPDMATAIRLYGDAARAALQQQGRPITEGSIHHLVGSIVEAFDVLQMTPRHVPYYEDDQWKFRLSTAADEPKANSYQVSTVWDKWLSNRSDQVSIGTINRYRPSISSFVSFVKDADIRDVTEDQVYDWAKHRVDHDNNNAKTVNKNDLVALKSLFAWAMSREGGRILLANTAKNVRLPEPKQAITREKSFRDGEISVILGAALKVDAGPNSTYAQKAQRWCPWLAAYSGARISELTGLRADDIRQEQGYHIMHFRQTKTGKPRSVPLHEHIIELGFLDFVKEAAGSHLFVDDVGGHEIKTPVAQIRSRKVAEWVRRIIKLEDGVDPNHGWRHTFKSRALPVMRERISDAITGHAGKSVARKYEHVPIDMMADALKNFPRYKI